MKETKEMLKSGQLLISDIQAVTDTGIEMGVLENGIPYLSQRGLVKMLGVPRTTFQSFSDNWRMRKNKYEGKIILKLLKEKNYTDDELFIPISVNGRTTYAYTEPVCMALMEYYAFEVDNPYPDAVKSFRILARAGFRKFVYDFTGYNPEQRILDSWRHFHDRIDMTTNNVPLGYFSIFVEIAQMIVPMIRSGVIITDKVVPDISVGISWSKYWTDNNLGNDRVKYEHNYPDYYRQSLSNPQDAWAYPDRVLGEFRDWLRREYITKKLPKYMLSQAKKGSISKELSNQIINSLENKSDFDKSLRKAIDHNPNEN